MPQDVVGCEVFFYGKMSSVGPSQGIFCDGPTEFFVM